MLQAPLLRHLQPPLRADDAHLGVQSPLPALLEADRRSRARQRKPLEPAALLDGILCGQQKFLSGYGGAKTTDPARLAEAREPKHVALSLMGEPTLYPYLTELLELIRRRAMTSFLVSNATNPEVLAELRPTQLYLSLNAPDEEMYRRVCRPAGRPLAQDPGEPGPEFSEHRCRSVIRMTLARGLNMERPEDYARLIARAEPDFVELKAYMHLGRSRDRLTREAMPSHEEILEFAGELWARPWATSCRRMCPSAGWPCSPAGA